MALFGPSVSARIEVGVGDTILALGGEADILGQFGYENMQISGYIGQVAVNTFLKGPVPAKKGMKLQKRATPVEDGNE